MFVKIFGPNLNDQTKGTFHVHLDGCQDGLKYGPGTRNGGDCFAADEMTVNVDDRVSVVEAVYSDQLREAQDVKPEDWLNDFWFAPCVESLPEFAQQAGGVLNKHRDPEVWDCMVDAIETRFLRTEFEEGEFEVHHNSNAGTITVIRRSDNRAWELTDTTGSHYDSEGRIVLK